MRRPVTITLQGGVRLDTDKDTRLGLKYTGGIFCIADDESTRSYDLSIPATTHNNEVLLYDEIAEMDGIRQKMHAILGCGGVNIEGYLYIKEHTNDRYNVLFVNYRRQKFSQFFAPLAAIWEPIESIFIESDIEPENTTPPRFGFIDYHNPAHQNAGGTVGDPIRLYPASSLGWMIDEAANAIGYSVTYLNNNSIYEDAGNFALVLPTMNTYSWDTLTVTGNGVGGYSYTIGGGGTLATLGLSVVARRYKRGIFNANKTVYTFTALRNIRVKWSFQFMPGMDHPIFVSAQGYTFLKENISDNLDIVMQAGDWFAVVNSHDLDEIAGYYKWNGSHGYQTNLDYPVVLEVSNEGEAAGLGDTIYLRDNMPDMSLADLLTAYCNMCCAAWSVDEQAHTITVESFDWASQHASLWKDIDTVKVAQQGSIRRYMEGMAQHNRLRCKSEGYVVEENKFIRDYPCDNDYLEQEADWQTIPFNEGNWQIVNNRKEVMLEDVSMEWDSDSSLYRGEYHGCLSIVFMDGTSGPALHLDTIDDLGSIGHAFGDFTGQAVTVDLSIVCPLIDFTSLTPSSIARWRGRDWIVREAVWGDGVAQLDLVRLPVEVEGAQPEPPQPEYTDLEYIEGTGTQYIDTGYKPNNNTECEYVAMQTGAINYLQSQTFFGCSDGAWNVNSFTFSTYQGGTFAWDGMGSAGFASWSCAINTNYTLRLNKTGAYLDGVLIRSTAGYTKSQNTQTLTLFAANYNSVTEFGKHRCYGCVIRENGVDVMNLVPKMRTADSKPGLYDTVNNVFYTNDGTGEFLYA